MIKYFKRDKLPKSKNMRLAIGISLLIGGIFGFLPILGFWMLPLGLLVLSVDSKEIRRFRRRLDVKFVRIFKSKKPE